MIVTGIIINIAIVAIVIATGLIWLSRQGQPDDADWMVVMGSGIAIVVALIVIAVAQPFHARAKQIERLQALTAPEVVVEEQ